MARSRPTRSRPSTEAPRRSARSRTRDDLGNVTEITAEDAFGHHRSSTMTYFPSSYINAAGYLSFIEFDARFGALTKQTGPNELVKYDALGCEVRHTMPWNAAEQTSYDGLFAEVTDPLGNVTTTEHDALGRLVAISASCMNGSPGWRQRRRLPAIQFTRLSRCSQSSRAGAISLGTLYLHVDFTGSVDALPTGRELGARNGHKKYEQALVPLAEVDKRVVVKSEHRGGCEAKLQVDDPAAHPHQFVESPV